MNAWLLAVLVLAGAGAAALLAEWLDRRDRDRYGSGPHYMWWDVMDELDGPWPAERQEVDEVAEYLRWVESLPEIPA